MIRPRQVAAIAAAALVMTACASDEDDPRASDGDTTVEVVNAYAPGSPGAAGAKALVDQTGPALGGESSLSNGDAAAPLAAVAEAEADGLTVGVAPSSALTLQPQVSEVGYGLDDFEPVLLTSSQPVVLAVEQDASYDKLRDLVAISKELTTKVASTGRQTPQGVDAAMFAKKSGADIVQKRFADDKESVQALVRGKADVAVTTAAAAIGPEQSGDIRVLGVFTPKPIDAFPDAPTMRSSGYDIAFGVDNVVVAPKGTSEEGVRTLRDAFKEAASSGEYQQFLTKNAYTAKAISGPALRTYLAKQAAQYKKAAR